MLTTTLLAVLLLQADAQEIKEYNIPEASFDIGAKGFHSLAISSDGKFLAAGRAEQVVVWDTSNTKEITIIAHEDGAVVNAVAFSPKGGLLASADHGGVIKITDTNTWKLKDTLKLPDDAILKAGFYRLAFSPDGAVLLSGGTGNNGDLVLWDVAKGIRQKRIHVSDKSAIQIVAFSPSGKRFAAVWDQKIKLWDHETCQEIREFAGHSMAFSPDGSKLALRCATGESKAGVWNLETKPSTKLWDLAANKEIALGTKLILGGTGACLCWSRDGKRLAFGGSGRVQVIDFDKPGELRVIHGVRGDFVCFTPDGKYLYAAGKQGAASPVTRWNLDAPPQDRIPIKIKP